MNMMTINLAVYTSTKKTHTKTIFFNGKADIDECKDLTKCPDGKYCYNTNGSYGCIDVYSDRVNEKSCVIGYRWNSTLKICVGM